MPIPKAATPFIDADLVHSQLDVAQMMQFATLVPPKRAKGAKGGPTGRKAVVIAADAETIRAAVQTH